MHLDTNAVQVPNPQKLPVRELSSDVKVTAVSIDFQTVCFTDHKQVKWKFGLSNEWVDRDLILNVSLTVENRQGKKAIGQAQSTLMPIWACNQETLEAGRKAKQRFAQDFMEIVGDHKAMAHPFLLWRGHDPERGLESKLLNLCKTSTANDFIEAKTLPPLAAMVVGSAFDWALFDAYGKVNERPSYQMLGEKHLPYTLGELVGVDNNKFLDFFLNVSKDPSIHRIHSIGGNDPLERADENGITRPDNKPISFQAWVEEDDVTMFKPKLAAKDWRDNAERLIKIYEIAARVLGQERSKEIVLYPDFNETITPDELQKFLQYVEERNPDARKAIVIAEQPSPRDLLADPDVDLHGIPSNVITVADECVVSPESLAVAINKGYRGVALKWIKGPTSTFLIDALAKCRRMDRYLMDLTLPPGTPLEQSLMLARVLGLDRLESNGPQFYPDDACGRKSSWKNGTKAGLAFRVRGKFDTSCLNEALSSPGFSPIV